MPEAASGVDAAVVKVGNGGGVDVGREWERWSGQTVLGLGDQIRLPFQTLYLPGPKGKGGDWDDP